MLLDIIREIHDASRRTCGARRIHAELVQGRGVAVARPPELIRPPGVVFALDPEIGEWPRRWTALAACRRAAPAVRRQTELSRPQGSAAGIHTGCHDQDNK